MAENLKGSWKSGKKAQIRTSEGTFEQTADTPSHAEELMLRSLRGSSIARLDRSSEELWTFSFQSSHLNVSCPWRMVTGGIVVLGSWDHGHKFGLPAPVDVVAETIRKVQGRCVERVKVSPTADLLLAFNNDLQVEAFNNSGGYEGWTYTDSLGVEVVAKGGGGLSIWDNLPKKA